MNWTIRPASPPDVDAIHGLLRANRDDPSLFQQSRRQLLDQIESFYVALGEGRVVGSVALVKRQKSGAEILAVAVHPALHGRGVGSAMLEHLIATAGSAGGGALWLGTAKPDYFARFGFKRMSRWQLPIPLLLYKLTLVFRQPVARWLPAVFGGHVFMRYEPSGD